MATSPHATLLDHVVLPVVHPDDAERSAHALAPYDPDAVTVVHVVEKGGGVPDKTPVEHSEEMADLCYETVREIFPEADDHTAYGTDVVAAIFETAKDLEASAIAYRSRGGGRVLQFLSGDRSLRLVTEPALPVVALPQPANDTNT